MIRFNIYYIKEGDIMKLLNLYIKMHKNIKYNLTKMQIIQECINFLNQPGCIPLGLYRNKELIGFFIGHPLNKEIFFWSSLYVEPKYRFKVKQLLDTGIDIIRQAGFKKWRAESATKEGQNIISRYKGKIIAIHYEAEV